MLSKAIKQAKEEWKENNPEVTFPAVSIRKPSVSKLNSFVSKEKADEFLNKCKEKLAKVAALKEEALQKKLESMTSEKKAEYDKKIALQNEAIGNICIKIADLVSVIKAKEAEKTAAKKAASSSSCN